MGYAPGTGVCGGRHWTLAVIDMDTKVIRYYDSMGGDGQTYLDTLKRYIYLV